jgi:ElaA protein
MQNDIFIKSFHALTHEELYQILNLRLRVFVIEQHCFYEDIDDKDQVSMHYFMKDKDKIVSYIRVIPPGYKYDEYAISRVVTDPNYRLLGLATQMIQKIMNDLKQDIRISGQAYLKPYYESLGFEVVLGPYMEDDIPHYEMLYQANKKK